MYSSCEGDLQQLLRLHSQSQCIIGLPMKELLLHRVDLISAVLKRKIAIIYADSNQTDVELVGEMCFPNLQFNVQEVQFGSVLNDTTGRHFVTMTNTSKVDAAFDWQFIEVERFDEEEGKHRRNMSATVCFTCRRQHHTCS